MQEIHLNKVIELWLYIFSYLSFYTTQRGYFTWKKVGWLYSHAVAALGVGGLRWLHSSRVTGSYWPPGKPEIVLHCTSLIILARKQLVYGAEEVACVDSIMRSRELYMYIYACAWGSKKKINSLLSKQSTGLVESWVPTHISVRWTPVLFG